MKLLEVCLSGNLGGLELYFHRCNLWFSNTVHDVTALVKKGSRLENLCDEYKINYITFPNQKKIFPLYTARRLAKWISENQIDTVHFHDKHDLALCCLAKFISVKKFTLVHTRQMQTPHTKKDPYHAFLYNKIDLLIAITDQLKRDLEQNTNLNKEKIKRLYYGVDKPEKEIENCSEIDKSNFNIGVFSRIEFQKGHHLVVEAANMLNHKDIHCNFHFWGDSMDDEYMEQLKSKIETYNLHSHIFLNGFHPDPLKVMPCLDVIILPSRNETFGLVLAEAMRAGTAVIGTNAGGVKEIIDHKKTGLLFEWDDPQGLANQIEILYLNPELKDEIAKAGEQKADLEFNSDHHFEELEELFIAKK